MVMVCWLVVCLFRFDGMRDLLEAAAGNHPEVRKRPLHFNMAQMCERFARTEAHGRAILHLELFVHHVPRKFSRPRDKSVSGP